MLNDPYYVYFFVSPLPPSIFQNVLLLPFSFIWMLPFLPLPCSSFNFCFALFSSLYQMINSYQLISGHLSYCHLSQSLPIPPLEHKWSISFIQISSFPMHQSLFLRERIPIYHHQALCVCQLMEAIKVTGILLGCECFCDLRQLSKFSSPQSTVK
jgi:hypothetical protein